MDPFRIYDAEECGPDGYPLLWHRNVDGELDELIGTSAIPLHSGIKHLVRDLAGHRCLRCRHPFVVGQSGEMEGPQAEAKALGAELGLNVEQLDATFIDTISVPPAVERIVIDSAPRKNWSECDGLCRHGGPMRAWVRDHTEERWEPFDPTPEACGPAVDTLIESGSRAQAAWRILTVHHLNEVKADLRWWNLVALCQRCHLLIQRKVTMDHPWPWEHSDWFRPYAAGFYASKYLGEELSREETEERLEMILAMGRNEEAVERMPL